MFFLGQQGRLLMVVSFFVPFPLVVCETGGEHRKIRSQLDTHKINYMNKIWKV
jgi:hypothetical protein